MIIGIETKGGEETTASYAFEPGAWAGPAFLVVGQQTDPLTAFFDSHSFPFAANSAFARPNCSFRSRTCTSSSAIRARSWASVVPAAGDGALVAPGSVTVSSGVLVFLTACVAAQVQCR